jgi:Xaa-Pro aminopeptidase
MTPANAISTASALDVGAIQAALRAQGLDGWLLYDFHGMNRIAVDVAGVGRQGGHLTTRRWYYLIPASGEPRALVHAIESHALAHLPGTTNRYSGRAALESGLQQLLSGMRRIAMEYSPGCAIPYVSRVDAGTIELVKQFGVDVASSGDLIQQFSAVWDERQIKTHVSASEKLYRVKDRAFEEAARRLKDGLKVTEFEIQQLMAGWFAEEGLISDSAPVVAAEKNAGDPHYLPTAETTRAIGREEVLLLDLWGKLDQPGAVFADITWVGYTGREVPARIGKAFNAVKRARDAAVELVEQRTRAGEEIRGFEVDRASMAVLRATGYGDAVLHRTGHSLGESVHGNGVNMDDYETHDDRRLLPGTGFTIEPGVYFSDFGIRSEINMIVGDKDATVTGPRQTEMLALL